MNFEEDPVSFYTYMMYGGRRNKNRSGQVGLGGLIVVSNKRIDEKKSLSEAPSEAPNSQTKSGQVRIVTKQALTREC